MSCAGHLFFLLILVDNLCAKLWLSLQLMFAKEKAYKCCSKASPPCKTSVASQGSTKSPVASVLLGGILAYLQGQLLHTAQLLHHKLELMLKTLILFQSCLLCHNTEQFRGTEKTGLKADNVEWKAAWPCFLQPDWWRKRSGDLTALSVATSCTLRAFMWFVKRFQSRRLSGEC